MKIEGFDEAFVVKSERISHDHPTHRVFRVFEQ